MNEVSKINSTYAELTIFCAYTQEEEQKRGGKKSPLHITHTHTHTPKKKRKKKREKKRDP